MERIQGNRDKLDAWLDKGKADRAELMVKLKASHAKYMAKVEAIDARRLKMEAEEREGWAKMEATWKERDEKLIKTFMGIGQKSTEA
jgi:hypothetical protein